MQPCGRFHVASDHPSLPGHFPGAPMVPGMVLLDRVVALLADRAEIAMLPQLRFLAPVRPEEVVEVAAERTGERIGFAAWVAGREVLRGTLQLKRIP